MVCVILHIYPVVQDYVGKRAHTWPTFNCSLTCSGTCDKLWRLMTFTLTSTKFQGKAVSWRCTCYRCLSFVSLIIIAEKFRGHDLTHACDEGKAENRQMHQVNDWCSRGGNQWLTADICIVVTLHIRIFHLKKRRILNKILCKLLVTNDSPCWPSILYHRHGSLLRHASWITLNWKKRTTAVQRL